MKLNTRIVLLGIVLVIGLSLAAVTVIGQTTPPPGLEPESASVYAGDDPAAAQSLERSVAGGPGFVMVNPFQFTPYSSTTQWAFTGTNLYNPSSLTVAYIAPLTLPNNVTITQVVAYYYDNAAGSITVYLMRCPVQSGGCIPMAQVSSSGASIEYRYGAINVISNPVVDQQNNSYLLELNIPGSYGTNLRLTGVRVDYANTTFLPILQK